MKKHTKGPWKVIPWGTMAEIRSEDNSVAGIAMLSGGDENGAIPSERTRANAHLIAASPDLLEALKAAKQLLAMHHLETQFEEETINEIQNAINKAQGR